MKKRFNLSIAFTVLLASLAIFQSTQAQVATWDLDGAEIECIQETIEVDESNVYDRWNEFISKRGDLEMDMERLVAKESITAHNATIGRAGQGALEIELIATAIGPDSSEITLLAKHGYQKFYPQKMDVGIKAQMIDLIKDFERFAETGFMQEDEFRKDEQSKRQWK